MYAIVEDKKVIETFNYPKKLIRNNIRYSTKIYSLWSIDEKKAIGLYEVEYDNTKMKNPDWYNNTNQTIVYKTTGDKVVASYGNATEGAFICLEINFNGSHTIGWNTVFEFAASTEPTETATDGKTDLHVFRYNGAVWQEVGRTLNLSES